MKTNKSFTNRLKITKNGKIKRDASGKCHFNAKENNSAKMAKKKKLNFSMSNKALARFLPKTSVQKNKLKARRSEATKTA